MEGGSRGRSPKHWVRALLQGWVEQGGEGLWFQVVSGRMSSGSQGCSPSPHTLSSKEQGSESGGRANWDVFAHSEGANMIPLGTSVSNKLCFSATEVFAAHLGTGPGVRKSTVTCHEGEGPGLRYRVPSICQALCEALNRGHHPESIPWQLTRWHYLHLTDEEPEAQRGKSLSKPAGQSGGAPFQEIHALPVTRAPSSTVSITA